MAQVAPGFLEQRLIEVSDLVRHDLREVLDALARDDSAVAQRVIEADDEIDRLCLALDRDAEILLVGNATSHSSWLPRASRATSSAWRTSA